MSENDDKPQRGGEPGRLDAALAGDAEGSVLGSIKQKLIDTKQRWAAEGRALTGEKPAASPADRPRLPPGQRLTKDFPVLDLGVQPPIEPKDFRLTVSGLVENPIDWGWEEFQAQPQVQMTTDIHCVTTWSRYDNVWEGVSGQHFLAIVKPKPEAKFMIFHSHDGYTTNVSIQAFAEPNVILAHRWNGQPISRQHGGPVRPIIPKLYLWKSAKWVKHITFLDKDAPGFWEVRGYHNDADPWKEQRYG
ncbi:MAG: sulfite oxidase-like oxidoreductase [Rhodospirillales bacterium]|nr:sulfite oxidase-like oxidoreductase [Rhodospirillales bacterium]